MRSTDSAPRDNVDAAWPLAYLLTWRTYGTWLPGDARGSIHRRANHFGDRTASAHPGREKYARQELKHASVLLTEHQRLVVEGANQETAEHAGWTVIGQSARTNHVHVVISTLCEPERAMNSLKSWATRRLREAGLLDGETKPWERHGSTRYLWTEHDVDRAVRYVLEAQDGERFEMGNEA